MWRWPHIPFAGFLFDQSLSSSHFECISQLCSSHTCYYGIKSEAVVNGILIIVVPLTCSHLWSGEGSFFVSNLSSAVRPNLPFASGLRTLVFGAYELFFDCLCFSALRLVWREPGSDLVVANQKWANIQI